MKLYFGESKYNISLSDYPYGKHNNNANPHRLQKCMIHTKKVTFKVSENTPPLYYYCKTDTDVIEI